VKHALPLLLLVAPRLRPVLRPAKLLKPLNVPLAHRLPHKPARLKPALATMLTAATS
jgi:hypothetical protein